MRPQARERERSNRHDCVSSSSRNRCQNFPSARALPKGISSTNPCCRRQLLASQGNTATEDRVRRGSAPKRGLADDGCSAPSEWYPLKQTQSMEGTLCQHGGQGTFGIKQLPRIHCNDQRFEPCLFGQVAGPDARPNHAGHRDQQQSAPTLPPRKAPSLGTALPDGHWTLR